MSVFDAIFLGIVQGITEFLPISSSGHLIVSRELFGVTGEYGLAFDAVLHFATAVAVVVYFRSDIRALIQEACLLCTGRPAKQEAHRRLLKTVAVATVPAAVLGLLLESYMETVFRSSLLVAGSLVAGSLIMFVAERVARKMGDAKPLTLKSGLAIGLFQSLALIPGMSRSGMAISGGLLFGLTREYAARFAFLLAVPLLLGSGVKKLLELSAGGALADIGIAVLFGAITAFFVGLAAIHWLLRFLRSNSLSIFIAYRLFLAVAIVLFSYWPSFL